MSRKLARLCFVLLSAYCLPVAAQDALPDPALTPPVLLELGTARHAHPWTGETVKLTWLIEVGVDGTVTDAKLVALEPDEPEQLERLRSGADPYVRGLRFSPARRNGVPVVARIRYEHLLEQEPASDTEVRAGGEAVTSAQQARDDEREAYGASAAIDAPLQATSSLNLSGKSLRRRPYFNAGDLLNGAPGFYVVQHGGGGKAQQYFLRGFDADHGTDVALFVDDVPVNMPTHGHGQGYSDLNWIIPELVETIEVRKGPFFAEFGDHAVAGSVNYRLRTDLPDSFVTGSVGMFDTYRSVGAARFRAGPVTPLFAAEFYRTNGPFKNDENYRRVSLFGRVSERVEGGMLNLTVQSFASGWDASGQIPLRAVRAGTVSRFGSIDPNEGGSSQRHSIALDYRRRVARDAELHVTAWLAKNRLQLYSNFGLFSADPVDGDMIRQVDDRVYTGGRVAWVVDRSFGSLRLLSRFGTQMRYDSGRPSVSRAPARLVTEPMLSSAVDEAALGAFVELDLRWSRWVRAVLGLRYDSLLAQVQDKLKDEGSSARSGERFADIVSPKLSLIAHANDYLDLFANFGSGFHSNDARGMVLRGAGRVDPFARALAYELGAKLADELNWELSWSGYLLDLESEVVWVGDDGTSEPRGKTRRIGTELNARVSLWSWLKWDGSVSYSDAAFVDNAGNADAVALAPRWLLQSGVEAEHKSGLAGRLSLLFVGDRPATEDSSLRADGFVRLDATIEYKRSWYGLQVAVQNLTDAVYRQAQFASVTRLPGESAEVGCPSGTRAVSENGAFLGCEDITFTPGLPLTVIASASLYF
jgi:outer membrane receptor protein involved in Fe transport